MSVGRSAVHGEDVAARILREREHVRRHRPLGDGEELVRRLDAPSPRAQRQTLRHVHRLAVGTPEDGALRSATVRGKEECSNPRGKDLPDSLLESSDGALGRRRVTFVELHRSDLVRALHDTCLVHGLRVRLHAVDRPRAEVHHQGAVPSAPDFGEVDEATVEAVHGEHRWAGWYARPSSIGGPPRSHGSGDSAWPRRLPSIRGASVRDWPDRLT